VKKKTIKKHLKRPGRKPVKKTARHPAKKITLRSCKRMSKQDLLEFKKIMQKKKEMLIGDIQHISDDTLKKSQKDASGDISGYTYHLADVATDNYDREFSLSLASSDRNALYELEDALKRIEEGLFGICSQCKSPIAKLRLKAVPEARLCVRCQEKLEQNNSL